MLNHSTIGCISTLASTTPMTTAAFCLHDSCADTCQQPQPAPLLKCQVMAKSGVWTGSKFYTKAHPYAKRFSAQGGYECGVVAIDSQVNQQYLTMQCCPTMPTLCAWVTAHMLTFVSGLQNLIRGRGVFCRSIVKSQLASPTFTPTYAALVAIINTKFPEIGELLLKRVISQVRPTPACHCTPLQIHPYSFKPPQTPPNPCTLLQTPADPSKPMHTPPNLLSSLSVSDTPCYECLHEYCTVSAVISMQ